MSDPLADAHAYAWNWFALHSSQRMQLVNFWLVAVAFLGAAFVQARTGHLRTIAVGLCIAGVIASVGFALLDARTRRLVHVAESALQQLETRRTQAGQDADLHLVAAAHQARTTRLSSYRYVIEGMQLTMATLFTIAAVLTLAGW
ncbi:hypothetical protein [Nocardia nova]|uniref:hypothetical protein n=1 Tax=Nocardia nova TaxID=37330 RepID=UPI0018958555|nr:hypothetical protein [Nocardia nova]MBF6150338.1 hypothetical protein [Nocardia nova]